METQVTTQPVQLGDFFRESWGYDQTNVDFYQVVRISASGKTVWLRRVRSAQVEDMGSGGTRVAPAPNDFYETGCNSSRDGTLKRTLKTGWQGGWIVNMTSYSIASLWDCKPAYETASGWGH